MAPCPVSFNAATAENSSPTSEKVNKPRQYNGRARGQLPEQRPQAGNVIGHQQRVIGVDAPIQDRGKGDLPVVGVGQDQPGAHVPDAESVVGSQRLHEGIGHEHKRRQAERAREQGRQQQAGRRGPAQPQAAGREGQVGAQPQPVQRRQQPGQHDSLDDQELLVGRMNQHRPREVQARIDAQAGANPQENFERELAKERPRPNKEQRRQPDQRRRQDEKQAARRHFGFPSNRKMPMP